MDAIIKQAVQEEMRRTTTCQATRGPELAEVRGTSSNPRRRAVATRLTSLLGRVRSCGRGQPSKKRQCKEHRLQVRWLHYDRDTKKFVSVKHKHGGGKRFVPYNDAEPLTIDTFKEKASALFFPNGHNNFAGKLEDMIVFMCDPTETAILEFPGQGTADEYLNENGLYPSSTHFFVRTQFKDDLLSEFEPENGPFSQEIGGISSRDFDVSATCTSATLLTDVDDMSGSSIGSGIGTRVVCGVCSCTYPLGGSCIRCEQNCQYNDSLRIDAQRQVHQSLGNHCTDKNEVSVNLDELREQRLSHLLGTGSSDDHAGNNYQTTGTQVGQTHLLPSQPLPLQPSEAQPQQPSQPQPLQPSEAQSQQPSQPLQPSQVQPAQVNQDDDEEYDLSDAPDIPLEYSVLDRELQVKEVEVHRNNVLRDMLEAFSDNTSLRCSVELVFIDHSGKIEDGRGSGVVKEALSIFWREFFNSLTTGAAEKVPAIRHDYQKSEWQSIGRILVIGFIMTGYFPIALSRAFVASCLFPEELLTTEWLVQSFHLYLSEDESQSMKKALSDECIDPSEDEDILEVLSSYKCYRKVEKGNMKKILEELAHQELIQRPKYVANAWHPIMKTLKQYKQFQDVDSLVELYDVKTPTTKKVCKLFEAHPSNANERECFDHLKRFVKSLDGNLLSGFLQFVTGSNIITTDKIEVCFRAESVSGMQSPVAHTCGPLLVIPSTYQSYNELSEQFCNILRLAAAWSFSII